MSEKFLMKHPITNLYIENELNRPKTKRPHTLFIVAHDTGNMNATARNHFSYLNRPYDTRGGKHFEKGTGNAFRVASAHVFIDDRDIVVTVPLDERAWHVRYNVATDNKSFGDDANDAAVGVELCFFSDINRSKEAYKKFVWFTAYLLHKYDLSWNKVTFHSVLDPGRKTDPKQAFDRIGVTYQSFLEDIREEYAACLPKEPAPKPKPAPKPEVKPEPKPLTKSETPLSVADANKLIELCQDEWAKADQNGKKEWHRIANVLRELSGQRKG